MSPSPLLCLWLSSTLALGASSDASSLEAGVKSFDAGYRAWDRALLEEAANRFEHICFSRPDSYEAHYWLGAARFHVLLHRLGDSAAPADRKEKLRLLEGTITALERAIELKPEDSEARALLSAVLGMQIAADPKSAFWLGNDVLEHRRLALKNDPDNPRAQYLIGSAYFHTPALLRRKDKGLEYFLKAEELYEKESAADRGLLRPTWGYGSCLTFIGRIYQEAGRPREANAYFKRALEINPQDKMARKCMGETEREHGSR